jgi:hypothetical protein
MEEGQGKAPLGSGESTRTPAILWFCVIFT